jgi:dipeptidyl aminopeptidase/acylaminoacyl peptidase
MWRRQLTRTAASESGPHFAQGEKAATFVRDNGFYLVVLEPGGDGLVQLVEAGPKKVEKKRTDSQKFLEEEERRLLRHVDDAAARKKRDEDRKDKEAPPHLDLADGESLAEGVLAGDGRHALLVVAQKPEAARTADVPDYVTVSAYSEMITARTKVGDAQETRRLVVFDLESRKPVWAYVEGVTTPEEPGKDAAGEATSPEKKPEETREAGEAPKKVQRELRWSLPVFSRDGRLAVAAVRATDNKDRWLVLVDPATGQGRVLDHQHDDAWVRETGPEGFGFMPDGRSLWFLSEAAGFMHLYVVDVETKDAPPKALTSGSFEVTDARLGPAGTRFYLTTNEVDAGERHLYSMALAGGPRTRLTTAEGAHLAVVSPDEATLADVYSNARTPPDVFLVPLRAGAEGRQVTTSTRPTFRTHAWILPRVVRFKARDGVEVPARLYTPEEVGAERDPLRPGVVFIHGAGYLQNAHHYWSQYYRECMFHHLLASRGYVVLDVDYRGSAGYGRDWRTAIASHMGGKDLDDIVDGAKYLVAEHGVDPARLGVYGGSYGGFLTLMALFTSPETFAAGAALRPVTDWAHYNHPYTANILGAPPEDALAYRRSSPIYYAEGLKGALLICHGMVDTNVHFQDSVRLAQRLIELRKENWELAIFPVENHAFEEAASWADEYKRILKLFERVLRGKEA